LNGKAIEAAAEGRDDGATTVEEASGARGGKRPKALHARRVHHERPNRPKLLEEELSRTIQIRGDQTLAELHRAIFDAFDREEEHMYEFQIGGKGPMDPKARRYVLPACMDDEDKPAGDVKRTTIGSLGLRVNDVFGYWFDFGDDWWHQINVVAVEERAARGKFPKVTKRIGKSPPQYGDWDEEEE
jgi:Plasmid pRiA4b ORF-3-like protein